MQLIAVAHTVIISSKRKMSDNMKSKVDNSLKEWNAILLDEGIGIPRRKRTIEEILEIESIFLFAADILVYFKYM